MPQALAQPRLDLATRSASARPSTWRDADRSIEAVAATETPVRTWIYDYSVGRSYEVDEVFDISGLTDAEVQNLVGCPILDSHSTWSTLDIVGVIVEARRENENRDLVVRFSIDETEPTIAAKVKSGTIRKVSLGAIRRSTGAVITQREGQVPLRRTPIDPVELSLVAVPADANATTRSAIRNGASIRDLADQAPNTDQEEAMNRDAIRSAMTAFTTAASAFSTQMAAALEETPAAPAAPAPADATRAAPVLPVQTPVVDVTRSAETPAPVAAAPVVQPATVSDVVVRSAADDAQIGGWRAVAATRGRQVEFDTMVAGGSSMTVLRSLADSYVTTTSVPTNGTALQPLQIDAQRSEEKLISPQAAVAAQRSGGTSPGIGELAAAIAQLATR